jgi:hypothetical protein
MASAGVTAAARMNDDGLGPVIVLKTDARPQAAFPVTRGGVISLTVTAPTRVDRLGSRRIEVLSDLPASEWGQHPLSPVDADPVRVGDALIQKVFSRHDAAAARTMIPVVFLTRQVARERMRAIGTRAHVEATERAQIINGDLPTKRGVRHGGNVDVLIERVWLRSEARALAIGPLTMQRGIVTRPLMFISPMAAAT